MVTGHPLSGGMACMLIYLIPTTYCSDARQGLIFHVCIGIGAVAHRIPPLLLRAWLFGRGPT